MLSARSRGPSISPASIAARHAFISSMQIGPSSGPSQSELISRTPVTPWATNAGMRISGAAGWRRWAWASIRPGIR